MKTYILDTNIILDSPDNIIMLYDNGNNKLILPEVVIDELDNKKSGFEDINYNARQFARLLEDSVITEHSSTNDLNLITCFIESINVSLTIVAKSSYRCDTTAIASNILNDRKILEIAQDYNQAFGKSTIISLSL